MLSAAAVVTIFIVCAWRFVQNIEEGYGEELAIINYLKQSEARNQEVQAGDYWDGEEIDDATGEVTTDSRPAVRHPKNRNRAYEGSA